MKTLVSIITSICLVYGAGKDDDFKTPPRPRYKYEPQTEPKPAQAATDKSDVLHTKVTSTFDNEEELDLNLLFENLLISGDYLGLGRTKATRKYVISMSPINSSGDIYHILAYIILSRAQNKDIPPIILTYDTPDTKLQVNRALTFCDWVSYKSHFADTLEIDTNTCQRQNKRQSELRNGLNQQNYTHFVDQKALTTIISHYFRQQGRPATCQTLKNGLSVINDTTYPDLKKVQQGAQAEIEKVKQHKGNGSLVVMHMRYSSKANKEQNPLVSLDGTRDFLIKKGYKVWFIFADSRKKGSFAEIKENRSNVFPYPHPTQKYTSSNPGKLNGTTDYGKFYHLHILLGLIDVDNVKFVGNTSGTLDVAALMGYQVYNLHNLAESINYQTARILIQSAFLAVDCVKYQITPSLKGDSSPKTKENYDTLVAWLTNNVHPTNTHVEDPTPHRSKAGYRELYYVQSLLDEEDELLPFI